MKVVFLDTIHSILQERLEGLSFSCVDATSSDLETCKKLVSDADGIVIRSRFPMDRSFLAFAPKLSFIARSGAGMENIDEEYCAENNIQLFNAPEGNRNAVGEQALGMLLSLMNNFRQGDEEVRQGIWNREKNRGEELEGKTIGILGYGNNGRAFAQVLRGFSVQVIAYDKYKDTFEDSWVKPVSLEELYKESDVISFHIPQNKETIYWANENFFNQLAKPIYLLNLSRGKIVATEALLNAIDAQKVKGAGLDVLEFEKASFEMQKTLTENPIFQRLIANPNVLLTPHVGGWTKESYFKLSNILADKIENWVQKKSSLKN